MMGLSRCYGVIKGFVILLNILFMALGVCVVGGCGYGLWGGSGSGQYRAGLAVLLAWGAALSLAALTGLMGACRGVSSWCGVSFALVVVTAVCGAGAAWWCAGHVGELRVQLRGRLQEAVRHNYGSAHPDTALLDALQAGLHCCGVDGPADWQTSRWAGAGAGGGAGAGAGVSELDLRISASAAPVRVPPSCGGGGGEGGGGVQVGVGVRQRSGCWSRVVAALGGWATRAAVGAASVLVALAACAGLTLALALTSPTRHPYKA